MPANGIKMIGTVRTDYFTGGAVGNPDLSTEDKASVEIPDADLLCLGTHFLIITQKKQGRKRLKMDIPDIGPARTSIDSLIFIHPML